jgi:hypothetical protein
VNSKASGKVVAAAVGGTVMFGAGVVALVVDSAAPALGIGAMILGGIYGTAPFLFNEWTLDFFGIKVHTIRTARVSHVLNRTIAATPSPPPPIPEELMKSTKTGTDAQERLEPPSQRLSLPASDSESLRQLKSSARLNVQLDPSDDARQLLVSEFDPVVQLAFLGFKVEQEIRSIARLSGILSDESEATARSLSMEMLIQQLEDERILNPEVASSLRTLFELITRALRGQKLEGGVGPEVTMHGPTLLAHLGSIPRSVDGLAAIVCSRGRSRFEESETRRISFEPRLTFDRTVITIIFDGTEINIAVPVAAPETEESYGVVHVLVANVKGSLWLADRSRGRKVPIVVVGRGNSHFIGNEAARKLASWLVDEEIA